MEKMENGNGTNLTIEALGEAVSNEMESALEELGNMVEQNSDKMHLGVMMWFALLPWIKASLGEAYYLDIKDMDDSVENGKWIAKLIEDKFKASNAPFPWAPEELERMLKAAE